MIMESIVLCYITGLISKGLMLTLILSMIVLYYLIGLLCAIRWSRYWSDSVVYKCIAVLIVAWFWAFLIGKDKLCEQKV